MKWLSIWIIGEEEWEIFQPQSPKYKLLEILEENFPNLSKMFIKVQEVYRT